MTSVNVKIPVWLDCDPGHDDAFAILFAAYHPGIELLGLSTTHGNSTVEQTTRNAGRVLTAIGRPDVPVFVGASKGLYRPAVHALSIHGESGLDGTSLLPEPAIPANREMEAADAMAIALLATPRRTPWLIATGALTNVAIAVEKYPQLTQHIKGLSIMGGAVGDGFTSAPMGTVDNKLRFGNWTPWAEFNIVIDPEAAASLLQNLELAAKITLITLDVTHQVFATKEIQDFLLYSKTGDKSQKPSKLRSGLVELLRFFEKTYAEVFGLIDGPPLHDPLAMAAVLDNFVEYEVPFFDYKRGIGPVAMPVVKERYGVKVITQGTHDEALKGLTQTGRTVVTMLPNGEAGVKIPRSLNVQRFWTILEECLRRADAKNALSALSG